MVSIWLNYPHIYHIYLEAFPSLSVLHPLIVWVDLVHLPPVPQAGGYSTYLDFEHIMGKDC